MRVRLNWIGDGNDPSGAAQRLPTQQVMATYHARPNQSDSQHSPPSNYFIDIYSNHSVVIRNKSAFFCECRNSTLDNVTTLSIIRLTHRSASPTPFHSMHKIILRAGALEAGVAPAVGAGITHFFTRAEGRTFHLLRPAPETFDEVRRSACFPLVPFSNRVRDGYFEFQRQRVQLSPNMPGQKHPMHGSGWRRAWTLTTHDDAHAELVLRHTASEWP
ncbi:MAG TPA: hypothetical protein VNR40_14515, partial [Steroidobacter sp.]|nr:hypothetical protein [Steroidobacter sp.]